MTSNVTKTWLINDYRRIKITIKYKNQRFFWKVTKNRRLTPTGFYQNWTNHKNFYNLPTNLQNNVKIKKTGVLGILQRKIDKLLFVNAKKLIWKLKTKKPNFFTDKNYTSF